MPTLDRWRGLLAAPQTLTFPLMSLMARDHAPPVVTGSGEVRMPTLGRIEYTLEGVPADVGAVFAAYRRLKDDPYDGTARLRLVGTDTDGVEWMLGWTIPTMSSGQTLWTFAGDDLDGLHPSIPSGGMSPTSETELVFVAPRDARMDLVLGRFVLAPQSEGRPLREHTMEVLGSQIRFAYDPATRALSVAATHSDRLPPTYTENWLGEPLRILFGELLAPRLVARNLGSGGGHVYVRRVSTKASRSGWAGLWDDGLGGAEVFWSLYSGLLEIIAGARGADGHPNFEAHKVTHLYEEVIQASAGSRWVWALTFASSIEGLANLLEPGGQARPDADAAAMAALVGHINTWDGDMRLKEAAVRAVHRAGQTTTIYNLRALKSGGVITSKQLKAWEALRNSVMHGSLVSPYSSEEEDAKLLALAAMMHALTREIVRRQLAAPASVSQDGNL